MKKKTLVKQDMKQTLTKQDIQKDLRAQLKIIKGPYFIYWLIISILYMLRLPGYIKYILIIITFLSVIIFARYCIKLYIFNKGEFEVTEYELLFKNSRVDVHRYNLPTTNYSLFFDCGGVSVDYDVYSYSKAGDKFYIITLKSKLKSINKPVLVYNTKYYEITPF